MFHMYPILEINGAHPVSVCVFVPVCPAPGPDRALFLPGGLLDRNDLPDYLDGTLAGE